MADATLPRALLVSLREPTDPMALHEQRCFAEAARLPLEHIVMHSMVHGSPSTDFLQSHDAVFFGGSGAYSVLDDVDWIKASIDVLLAVVDQRIPSWASCFGFQGLSLARGGEVINDESKAEMGATLMTLTKTGRADPLLAELPDTFWVQEGHHDRVSRLPSGVTLIATGDFVHEQAFTVDGAPFWASQFHPELTVAKTVDRFHHYREFYLEDHDAPQRLAEIQAGQETPGVTELLARLVRHQF